MNKLEKALSSFLSLGEVAGQLARLLAHAAKTGRVSYSEAERIAKVNAEDVLLLGSKWRLLLPIRTAKSAAWEDRLLLTEPGEIYEMPNIVRYLVENASYTGRWDVAYDIAQLFRVMGEPDWDRMPKFIERLGEEAKDYRINAVQIKQVCAELGMGDRVDALIASLKGSGVMSPKLSSLAEVAKAGAPVYELNPSLVVNKHERKGVIEPG
ncbi:MAG: hypothetical protein KAX23_00900 [Dehalococcoidia bacterium]|jgi:hypothetical protein|nr:hypothetical protein [Chloroflexota bacterium]MCK4242084.1 hypothetical protein [Dehalococcoidia bacterium]